MEKGRDSERESEKGVKGISGRESKSYNTRICTRRVGVCSSLAGRAYRGACLLESLVSSRHSVSLQVIRVKNSNYPGSYNKCGENIQIVLNIFVMQYLAYDTGKIYNERRVMLSAQLISKD